MQILQVIFSVALVIGALYTGLKSGVIRFGRNEALTYEERVQRKLRYGGLAIVMIACVAALWVAHENPRSEARLLIAIGIVCGGAIAQKLMVRVADRIDASR
jgi:hypothetical protein